jgi:hypothetical protein
LRRLAAAVSIWLQPILFQPSTQSARCSGKSLRYVVAEFIVGREYTNNKAVDFSAQITKIKGKNADLVFFGGLDRTDCLQQGWRPEEPDLDAV